jgi:integration host factor subunit alpha
MTKADLADKIHERLYHIKGYSKKECYDLVDQVFELVKNVVVQEGKLKVAGFGNFEVKEKHARRGRNPQTGDEITIAPRRILTFKASNNLKKKVGECDVFSITAPSANKTSQCAF